MWSEIHMLPEQSLRAHIDVKAEVMMPIHNSTFDLALHNWFEPLEKITALAEQKQVKVSTPKFGEVVNLQQLAASKTTNPIQADINESNASNSGFTNVSTNADSEISAADDKSETTHEAYRPWWHAPLM
ncbi:hypothetical protein Q4561_10270 [Alteromonas sp. 1_MG-2023]|uniref:MBL fold metallo-hydrolase n=1 Tax=Alteromonas sp. 1_MG-2023 TaxID=3062669 RepID=UPI0026E2B6D3|nr:hypothetical protein [Alteromonas sp. 1_MG-2023]MDO6567441.1 hypothetical protein [Alteromonas sp. 1_MG-2023]